MENRTKWDRKGEGTEMKRKELKGNLRKKEVNGRKKDRKGRKREGLRYFRKGISPRVTSPSDNFPSGSFPNVQFPKRQLSKGQVRPSDAPQAAMGAERYGQDGLGGRVRWLEHVGVGPSAAARTNLGSLRLENCTFCKFPIGKTSLGCCHLGKYPWESS